MSGVHRLLTRKDKRHGKEKTHGSPNNSTSGLPSAPRGDGYGDLGPIFTCDSSKKKPDKEEEKKIASVQQRLLSYGITKITSANIEYALNLPSIGGSINEALRLCLLLEDTYEGLLKPFDANTKLLGAVNRDGVTCYLDALLFAMFARLDGFEAMLYNSLQDAPRKKLAGLLRLWVNMLRTGRLITTDVTMHLQAALAECGWDAAAKTEQQDTSEAFTFITGQLELPLLTLKMDLFHTGKEEPDDDHKFINERLLEVAILDEPPEGESVVRLEDCLEHYFNNRVEVKRHLERQRRLTLDSLKGGAQKEKPQPDKVFEEKEKLSAIHVETAEIIEMSQSPTTDVSPAEASGPSTPATETPKRGAVERLRPSVARHRADSIFNQRRINLGDAATQPTDIEAPSDTNDEKRGSVAPTRTEVLMPAWQFFKLLPWYTDHMPTSDAQVAAHFALKRPILGICLKRYTVNNEGKCERLDRYVDIPLEIAVPDFVSDDDMEEGGPLVGNFKLVLQSIVCHRGSSVHSGHYISLVRGHASNAVQSSSRPPSTSSSGGQIDDMWMLFDDLARERVRYVDIATTLKEECPYLLFYQVKPIDDLEPLMSGPPSYDEAISRTNSNPIDIREKVALPEYSDSELVLVEAPTLGSPNGMSMASPNTMSMVSPNGLSPFASPDMNRGGYLSATEPPSRSSLEVEPRGRTSTSSDGGPSITFEERRPSIAMTHSGPQTPAEEGRLDFLKFPSRRGSRQSKHPRSRPTSVGAESSASRFGLSMSRLTTRLSRADLPPPSLPSSPLQEPEAATILAQDHAPDSAIESSRVLTKKKEKQHESVRADDVALAHRKIKRKGEVPDRDCAVM